MPDELAMGVLPRRPAVRVAAPTCRAGGYVQWQDIPPSCRVGEGNVKVPVAAGLVATVGIRIFVIHPKSPALSGLGCHSKARHLCPSLGYLVATIRCHNEAPWRASTTLRRQPH